MIAIMYLQETICKITARFAHMRSCHGKFMWIRFGAKVMLAQSAVRYMEFLPF